MGLKYYVEKEGVFIPIVRVEGGSGLVPSAELLDSFGRNRISNPTTIFESQQQYDNSPLLWESTGTVTHDAATATTLCSVTAAGKTIRQTKQYHRYTPGKSQLIMMTFVMDSGTGLRQRIGYFDDDNGVFLERDGTTLNIVLRTGSRSPSEVRIPSTEWNGSLLSPIDTSKAQIFFIDLEWLGVGSVRTGFVIDGRLVIAHQFNHANVIDTTYMTTANLPARYEIESLVDATGSLRAICTTVISEGGFEADRGYPFSAGNGSTAVSVAARVPVFSIAPKTTFNGITNRGLVKPLGMSVYSNNPLYVEVVYGGTLTSPSFGSVNDSSIVNKDVAASGISGGITIRSFYIDAAGVGGDQHSQGVQQSEFSGRLPLTLDIAGTTATPLSIVATPLGSTASVRASFNWLEVR